MNPSIPSPHRSLLPFLAPALGALLWAAPGCMVTGRGELPIGEWSGRGTFIYEEWHAGGPGAAQSDPPASTQPHSVTISRDYDTNLSVKPDKLDGTDILRVEIRSTRGELPNLEEETHLVMALVPVKRVSDSAQLYRALAVQFNPKPDEPLRVADDAPPFIATCMTRGDTTTFQIGYTENFVDVFRFQGWTLEKSGVYFQEKRGLIHWNERLTRRR